MDDIPFRTKEPKTGSNKPNVNTVRMALPNNTFSPKPMGNIWMNGAIISKVGMLNTRFRIHLDFWVSTKEANISNPAKAGMIKNPAPFRKMEINPLMRIQINNGAMKWFIVTFLAEKRW